MGVFLEHAVHGFLELGDERDLCVRGVVVGGGCLDLLDDEGDLGHPGHREGRAGDRWC